MAQQADCSEDAEKLFESDDSENNQRDLVIMAEFMHGQNEDDIEDDDAGLFEDESSLGVMILTDTRKEIVTSA